MNINEHFEKESFVIVNNFLQPETVMLLYHHVKIMAQRQALIMERKQQKLDIITKEKLTIIIRNHPSEKKNKY